MKKAEFIKYMQYTAQVIQLMEWRGPFMINKTVPVPSSNRNCKILTVHGQIL